MLKNNKNDILQKVFCLVLSIFSLVGIVLYFNIQKNNILLVPILYFLYIGFYNNIFRIIKKDIIYCGIISFIYSTLLIIGYQLDTYNGIVCNLRTFMTLICLPIFIFLIVYKLFTSLNSVQLKSEDTKQRSDNKIKIITFLGIIIPWMIGFLALFPGVYGYDAGFQFMQFDIEEVALTSHFSILYSYIFYFTVNLGNILFKSYQIGFAIYSFLQMLFLGFVAYKVCYYIYKKFNNIKILFISICFFSVSPFFMILAISSCQDAIFAGIFTLVVLLTMEIVDYPSEFWKSWKKILKFFLLVLLLCAFRYNGLYAFIVLIPFGLILLKENKIKFLLVTFLIIVVFQIYKGPIHNVLKVQQGDSLKEMSSVVVQQLGRVYCYKRDTLSKEEFNYITQLIPEDYLKIYEYNPCISDSLKANLNVELLKSDYSKFMKNYLSIGIKNIDSYIEAFLLNNIGAWYPNKVYPDSRMYHPYIEYQMLDAKKWNERYIVIQRDSLIPVYEKALNVFINKSVWNRLPIVSTMFSAGTIFFILLFVIAYILYNKKYMYLLPMSIIIGLYLTILLAPVTLYRYVYPIFLVTPIIISMVLKNDKKEQKD